MITVESKAGGIACLILALFFLGSFAPGLHYCERKGRHPAHTYFDFSLGYLAVAVVAALTLGEFGASDPANNINFIEQLKQDNGACVGFAMAAGAFVQFGNFGVQWGCALCGVIITMAANGSLIVVIGTTLNWFLDDKVNKPELLFPGIGCFLIAVIFSVATHIVDQRYKRSTRGDIPESALPTHNACSNVGPLKAGASTEAASKLDDSAHAAMSHGESLFPNVGTELAMHTAVTKGALEVPGTAIVVAAGVSCGFYNPGFNLASNDQFHVLPRGVAPLTTYTGYFYFCICYIFLAWLETIWFLYWPPFGLPKSSWAAYFKDNDWLRVVGFTAGVSVSIANVLTFVGGQVAGYATSDLVAANPLVSTVWGLLLFREFRSSPVRVWILLACMGAAYCAAIGLLIGSAGSPKNHS
ncbi:hypothetical protein WJX73_010931 [Symbiochloris irregularis]|uniref:Ureide permease n=1 Tax=Symbiochloris irregularis TaxID=706552 RepID=A0AAW1PZG8_9CHLO